MKVKEKRDITRKPNVLKYAHVCRTGGSTSNPIGIKAILKGKYEVYW